MEPIRVEHLCKSFDGKPVLRDFSAVFPAGKVSALMAPSGFGKTTLLRILMGLELPDSGKITGLLGKKQSAVFQEDRLCRNLDAAANIRLVCPGLRREEALRAMESVGLAGCAGQPVRELSGGMCRRVAILRALLAESDVLFLDEPFKGLDAETKQTVMQDTKTRCAGKTVLLVTHSREEAQAMGAVQVLAMDQLAAAPGRQA